MHLDRHAAKHELPYPLAVLYDRVRQHDPKARLDAVLGLVEGICRYVAFILLADAGAQQGPRASLKRYAEVNGFGKFLNAIQYFVGARSHADGRIFQELDAIVGGETWKHLSTLNHLRNDDAHWRLSPTPNAAQRVLNEQVAAIQAVLDAFSFLRRYPLGMVQGLRTLPGPRTQGQWYAARGLSLRSAFVLLEDLGALPSDQLIVVDSDRRRALTVAPFLVVIDDAFLWHDAIGPGSPARKLYASPAPGTPLSPAVPDALYDPGGRFSSHFTIERWLESPSTWCQYTNFPPSGGAFERIMDHTRSTLVFESAGTPAAAEFSSDPGSEPTYSVIPPIPAGVAATPAPPVTVLTPQPSPLWSPAGALSPTLVAEPTPSPMLATMVVMAPLIPAPPPFATPTYEVPPEATQHPAQMYPSPPPASPAQAVSQAPWWASAPTAPSTFTPHNFVALVIAVGTAGLALGLLAFFGQRRVRDPQPEPPAVSGMLTERHTMDALPAQPEYAPLGTWPELQSTLIAWDRTAQSQTVEGATDLNAFYADSLAARSYRSASGIQSYYVQFFQRNEGQRHVDWTNSQWRVESPGDTPEGRGSCGAVPGAANGVLKVALMVTENDPSRPRRGSSIPCARLQGYYTLLMRAIPGTGLQICYEDWTRESLCAPAACPSAARCRTVPTQTF